MSDWQDLIDQGLVRTEVRLDALTTYKLGGAACWYAEVGEYAHLSALAGARSGCGDVLVLGKGSNVIISDEGYEGLVIRLVGDFLSIRHPADRVEAGGGVGLPRLARSAVGEGRLGTRVHGGHSRDGGRGCLPKRRLSWNRDGGCFGRSGDFRSRHRGVVPCRSRITVPSVQEARQ